MIDFDYIQRRVKKYQRMWLHWNLKYDDINKWNIVCQKCIDDYVKYRVNKYNFVCLEKNIMFAMECIYPSVHFRLYWEILMHKMMVNEN